MEQINHEVSFCVIINREPHKEFKPHGGLMLRDPLSHYLFILCVKTLYVKSSQATQARAINGINVCSCAPQISNLLFVDDSIIFARSTLEEANPITSILKAYEEASSQRINFQKIKLSCSQNMPCSRINELKMLLGVQTMESHSKYLGIPTIACYQRNKFSNSLKRGCGRSSKGGKKRLYQRWGEKF